MQAPTKKGEALDVRLQGHFRLAPSTRSEISLRTYGCFTERRRNVGRSRRKPAPMAARSGPRETFGQCLAPCAWLGELLLAFRRIDHLAPREPGAGDLSVCRLGSIVALPGEIRSQLAEQLRQLSFGRHRENRGHGATSPARRAVSRRTAQARIGWIRPKPNFPVSKAASP